MNQKYKILQILAFIFFLSGFSALVYQIIWQRYLTLYYGVGPVSVTLIVSIYMAGLGFGALAGGYFAERIKRKLLFYFIIELLIGLFGIISLPFLDYLGKATAGSSYFLSAFFIVIFLCAPTFLMGMTLPLLTKIYNHINRDFLNTVSFLYFINTIGAAAGALVTSYILISFFGMHYGIAVAVFINILLALMIYITYSKQSTAPLSPVPQQASTNLKLGNSAFILVFVTGFLAIGYEIVWIRSLSILLKSSPYVFSTVLAVYLTGIAIGSFVMGHHIKKWQHLDQPALFFALQLVLALTVSIIFIAYYYLTKHTDFGIFSKLSFVFSLHPDITRYAAQAYPPDIAQLISTSPGLVNFYHLFDIFFWPLIFVLLPALFMGASFPLIASLALTHSDREAETVGKIYFLNVLGNIAGALITGFVLLQYLGTEVTLLLFIFTGMTLGLFIPGSARHPVKLRTRMAVLSIAALIIYSAFPPREAYYKLLHPPVNSGVDFHIEEGVEGVVATYKYQDQVRNYINGLEHGGRPGYNFYYETLEALRFSAGFDNILVIGYGTGSVTEAVLKMDNAKSVTIVELNPTLIKNLRKFPLFDNMLNDPRVELVYDDARRYLLKSNKKYDLILTDPLRSTTAYSNNLYSSQFFSLANEHLKPGGVFMVWMDEHYILPKTVASAFKHVRIYDYFTLASNQAFSANYSSVKPLLTHFNQTATSAVLDYENKTSYLGNSEYINKKAKNYPINNDWQPWLEYYIGVKSRELLRPTNEEAW